MKVILNNKNNKEPTENLLKKPVPIQIYDNFANYLRKLFNSDQKLKDFDHQGQINPVFNGNPDEKIFDINNSNFDEKCGLRRLFFTVCNYIVTSDWYHIT